MSTVDDIEAAVATLSEGDLDRFQVWFAAHLDKARGAYAVSPEDLAAINDGLREAEAGAFAADEEVEAVFGKYSAG